MDNIFEGAKFGDTYFCKDGRKMQYVMQDENEVTLLEQTPYRDFIWKYNFDGTSDCTDESCNIIPSSIYDC